MLTPLTTTLKHFRNVISRDGISKTIQINNIALSLMFFFKKGSKLISYNVCYRKKRVTVDKNLIPLLCVY